MYKRTYILGAIYIIGNRVYVNCMCNHEKHDTHYKTVGFTNYPSRKWGSVFPYALFLFYKRKTSIFENMKGKKVKSMEIKIRNHGSKISLLRIDELAKKKGIKQE